MTRPFPLPTLSSPHAGLDETLHVLATRRRLLGMLGGAAALAVLPSRPFACTLIPQETAGPYPGDGTNGPNVLTASGIVRQDIRTSFGSAGTTSATGTLNTITLRLVSTTTSGCGRVAGLAVYLWHCNATGGYSLYSSGVTTQNYLRGVQVTDASGVVNFTTIFPGCYAGRYPHIHFEVYPSLSSATLYTNRVLTSQLALPRDICQTVYGSAAGYSQSVNNLAGVTIASDGVFGDNSTAQMAQMTPTLTGSADAGYDGSILVGVPA
jgi:protocatechuate 3,4-dioxygenase beta subunit